MFIAGLVKCTPSVSRYPSFIDPSPNMNDGELSTNTTLSFSEHMATSPAFTDDIVSYIVVDVIRGNILETVML